MAPSVAPTRSAVTEHVDAELATRLRLVVSRLARRVRLATTDDLPPLQLSALVTVEQHGPLRLGELAQREAVTAPTMTKVLASLEDRGYVHRRSDPADARSVLISASEAGRGELSRIRSERTALLGARLARLSDTDRDTLRSALPALEALLADDRRMGNAP